MVLSSGLAFAYELGAGRAAAASYHPPLLYAALLALLLFPGAVLHRDARLFFGATLWRVVTPIRPVTWADFLLADVLTSLAKALSDTERAVCHLMIGPVMQTDLKVGVRWRVGWVAVQHKRSGESGGVCMLIEITAANRWSAPPPPPHTHTHPPPPPHHPRAARRPAATPRLSFRLAWRHLTPGAWCSACASTWTPAPAPSSSTPSSTPPPSR